MSPRSIGYVTTSVLRAVADGHRYGADILQATDLGSGTVYKVLRRLEQRGHVAGRWEDPTVAEAERRPRRRYYEVTAEGREVMREALERFRSLGAPRGGLAQEGG